MTYSLIFSFIIPKSVRQFYPKHLHGGRKNAGRSSCKVSVTVTDLHAETGDDDKTSSNAQHEIARNSSGYADVAQ